MNVYITVDTEVWPAHEGAWPREPLPTNYLCERELEAYFLGRTQQGDFGLPFQLEALRSRNLQATYFVDPLFSFVLGIEPLRMVVRMILDADQRIGLHLHPEWLTDPRCRGLPAFRGPYISQYPLEEQRALMRCGVNRLREAGAPTVTSFRAGSWGADMVTLRALSQEGIYVDSSLNAASRDSLPSLPDRFALQEPTPCEGVVVFPLSRLDDRVASMGRPLSVTGTTWSEMRFALESCYRAGRKNFVLVMHSKELIKTERLRRGRAPAPQRIVVRRFERLCEYLHVNRGRFATVALPERVEPRRELGGGTPLPKSSLGRTAARFVSQAVSRWY